MKKRETSIKQLRYECPECGSGFVTPLEWDEISTDAIVQAEDNDELKDVNVCWNCGYVEYITIKISVERVK